MKVPTVLEDSRSWRWALFPRVWGAALQSPGSPSPELFWGLCPSGQAQGTGFMWRDEQRQSTSGMSTACLSFLMGKERGFSLIWTNRSWALQTGASVPILLSKNRCLSKGNHSPKKSQIQIKLPSCRVMFPFASKLGVWHFIFTVQQRENLLRNSLTREAGIEELYNPFLLGDSTFITLAFSWDAVTIAHCSLFAFHWGKSRWPHNFPPHSAQPQERHFQCQKNSKKRHKGLILISLGALNPWA